MANTTTEALQKLSVDLEKLECELVARGLMKPAPTCTVTLTVADAIGVAHSIRALVRHRSLPAETVSTYERVAAQLLSAAKLAQQAEEALPPTRQQLADRQLGEEIAATYRSKP